MSADAPSTAVLTRSERSFERFRLRVVSGADAGATFESNGLEVSVGSAESNDLCLADPSVSRHHFVVRVTDVGLRLEDLGSTNGTTLGGYRVDAAYLAPGGVIGAGATTLAVELLERRGTERISPVASFGDVLGASAAMRRLFARLGKVAPTDATVLLEGETGVGKTVVAAALHDESGRAGPFRVIDCSSIPHNLIEAELFGHEKGAFTGAAAARAGLFESAEGGTVFLDEIGELPLAVQAKLLRVLEARVIRRVGSNEEIPVVVRVIAATHRDLRKAVNADAFRPDLWYRLSTVRLVVPPLRERREDIPLLVKHFYRRFARGPDPEPPPEMVANLQRRSWPGNVRELRSAVERWVIFEDDDLRDAETAEVPDEELSFRAAKHRAVARWERAYLTDLYRRHDGNVSRASRAARMDRSHLRELWRRHGIT